ncbi:MAG: autoinducer binding domain-containing protein [Lautropia sp.]|nr:autoinducer binding domain-containing protein [Lautropia sp.]
MAESAPAEDKVLTCLERATRTLGFRYFSFAHHQSLPISTPRMIWRSNYPIALQDRYLNQGYALLDPVIAQARSSQTAFVWNEPMFDKAQALRQDLLDHGIRFGWTKSVLNGGPEGQSMLALSREHMPLLPQEIVNKTPELESLLQLSHSIFSRICRQELASHLPELTKREAEILRWTIDGKSARDIAEILAISKNTIDFHIKNSIQKLNVPNKTAASIRAAMLGLLQQDELPSGKAGEGSANKP